MLELTKKLQTWKNQTSVGKVVKGNIPVANNYLTEDEASKPNTLVSMFSDYAENLTEQGKKICMQDWLEKLDFFRV